MRGAGALEARERAPNLLLGRRLLWSCVVVAASVGALCVYDMVKAVEKGVVIESVRLLDKTGGKSGDWSRRSR